MGADDSFPRLLIGFPLWNTGHRFGVGGKNWPRSFHTGGGVFFPPVRIVLESGLQLSSPAEQIQNGVWGYFPLYFRFSVCAGSSLPQWGFW